jgi:hypothetical protein
MISTTLIDRVTVGHSNDKEQVHNFDNYLADFFKPSDGIPLAYSNG